MGELKLTHQELPIGSVGHHRKTQHPSTPLHVAVMLINSLYRASNQHRLCSVKVTTIMFVS